MIEHARVVLLRPAPAGFELLLVRRDVASFPGGAVHGGEDVRIAAARTVFEDCTVLLARDVGGAAETLELPTFGALRKKIRGGANATEVLRKSGLSWASESLLPWSHWMTPSFTSTLPPAVLRGLATPGLAIASTGAAEAQRTSTRLFVAELPGGMRPAFDATEPATEQWLAPRDAENIGELAPMLVRTCWELARHVSIKAVLEAARKRAGEQVPILPRLATRGDAPCVLLPWDPEYERAGQGESHPLPYQPSWAIGPSRFILEERTWRHVAAPGSTSAG